MCYKPGIPLFIKLFKILDPFEEALLELEKPTCNAIAISEILYGLGHGMLSKASPSNAVTQISTELHYPGYPNGSLKH